MLKFDIKKLSSNDRLFIGDFVRCAKLCGINKKAINGSRAKSMIAKGYIVDFGDRYVMPLPIYDGYKKAMGI